MIRCQQGGWLRVFSFENHGLEIACLQRTRKRTQFMTSLSTGIFSYLLFYGWIDLLIMSNPVTY